MTNELKEKIEKSIQRLKTFEPPEGYYLAFSGGKDSCVCKALLDMAGCKYDAHYRVTGIDPPELVKFIKEVHPDVHREVPRDKDGKPLTMWNIIPKHYIPPTRVIRYCCKELKESSGDGRLTVTGVRWDESTNRKNNNDIINLFVSSKKARNEMIKTGDFEERKSAIILVNDNDQSRRMVETCYKRNRTNINPIIDWTEKDVWEFIHEHKIPYCSLYDEGFRRLGCIGCPLARKAVREREFARFPKYKEAYLKSFEKMIAERKYKGKETEFWNTAEDVFRWWMEYDVLPGQINLFDEEESQ